MKLQFDMQRRLLALLGVGLGLLILGAVLWISASPVQATPNGQGDPPNLGEDYRGTEFCVLCHTQNDSWHNTSHANMVQPASAATILGDLNDIEALTISWPDGETRPLHAEDITYVLGGRYMQRYVSVIENEDGTANYYVLPAQWNVPQTEDQAGVWVPYQEDDWQAPERDWRVACAGCHTTGLDGVTAADATVFAFVDDWDAGDVELNIGCEACHGPGGAHMGDAGTIVSTVDAQICGQCHIQGMSPDGDHAYPVGYQPGLPLDETVFVPTGLEDADIWWPTGHAKTYNQYMEWLSSGHGRELGLLPEECQRCHAPGDDNGVEVSFGVTCTACHAPHGETPEDGVVPDYMLLDDPYALCVSCHNSRLPEGNTMLVGTRLHYPVQEMFEGQQIVDTVEPVLSGHFTSPDGPRCVTCHMPQTVLVGEIGLAGSHTMDPTLCTEEVPCFPDSCRDCHTDLNPEFLSAFVQDTQAGIEERLTAVQNALDLHPDASAWVGTVADFVANDGSMGIHNYAYTDALLRAAEVELRLVVLDPVLSASFMQMEDPTQCENCHRTEFMQWQASPHAQASSNDVFLQEYANQGRPAYCMSCHASGYDVNTGQHQFEGVVCSNCHVITSGNEHPPAPVEIAKESVDCGRCHSGAHAPTYDEWLVSNHKLANIDCVDCHTPHQNGLILGDVNTTCGDCHQEALVDDVHMGQDLTCVECHMQRRESANGQLVRTTGHTMSIDPGTCAECHGNTHMLSVREVNQLDETDAEHMAELEAEVERLEEIANEDQTSNVLGGALGTLIVVVILFLVVRLRKLL
ncbi:MAG: hypothetical protein K8S97_09540 [Anaerolineae bacterium]|nr:hypothetical protein [Anaerolineae bacterium]